MPIRGILPIIIPGVLLQLFIQVYYIRHCWKNPRLSSQQRLLFIIAIAAGNLPAVAFYLFKNGEKALAQILQPINWCYIYGSRHKTIRRSFGEQAEKVFAGIMTAMKE